MNYDQRKSLINSTNDGNHLNRPMEFSGYSRTEEVKCGYCGEIQQDAEKRFCDECEKDEFIRGYINGK